MLLPHDWVTHQLRADRTAEPTTDRGDASGTGYWSPATGEYRPDLMRLAFGREFGVPRVAAPSIQLTTMQTTGHALPELDTIGREAKAGPIWRPRNGYTFKAPLELGYTLLEKVLFRDGPTLLRCPGTDLTATCSRGKICVSLMSLDCVDPSFDTDLNLHRLPVETHCSLSVRQELASLTTLEIRVEHETVLVGVLE